MKYSMVNDTTCIERNIQLKKLNEKEIKELNRDYQKRKEEGEKLREKKEYIPDDEEIFYEEYRVNNIDRTLELQIFSREKWREEKEKKIVQTLNKNGYKSIWNVNLDEDNWLRIDGLNLDKTTLLNVEEILNAKDFEIIFDGHMEEVFVVFNLNEEEKCML